MTEPDDARPFAVAHPEPPPERDRRSQVRLSTTITPEQLRVFLGKKETQEVVRKAISARVRGADARTVIDDIVQETFLAALGASHRPRSMDTAEGWIGILARRKVADYFRAKSRLRAQFAIEDVDPDEVSVEEAPADAAWLMAPWLAEHVAGNARDEETYELLVHKGRTGQSYEELAAAHGLTEPALRTRVAAFKAKYAERWRKRREARMFLFLLVAVPALVIAAYLLWTWLHPPVRTPRPEPALAPSVSEAPPRPPAPTFDQALPTQPTESAPVKPPAPTDDGKPPAPTRPPRP